MNIATERRQAGSLLKLLASAVSMVLVGGTSGVASSYFATPIMLARLQTQVERNSSDIAEVRLFIHEHSQKDELQARQDGAVKAIQDDVVRQLAVLSNKQDQICERIQRCKR